MNLPNALFAGASQTSLSLNRLQLLFIRKFPLPSRERTGVRGHYFLGQQKALHRNINDKNSLRDEENIEKRGVVCQAEKIARLGMLSQDADCLRAGQFHLLFLAWPKRIDQHIRQAGTHETRDDCHPDCHRVVPHAETGDHDLKAIDHPLGSGAGGIFWLVLRLKVW